MAKPSANLAVGAVPTVRAPDDAAEADAVAARVAGQPTGRESVGPRLRDGLPRHCLPRARLRAAHHGLVRRDGGMHGVYGSSRLTGAC